MKDCNKPTNQTCNTCDNESECLKELALELKDSNMKLIIGKHYKWWFVTKGDWIYEGFYEGDYTCNACGKPRDKLHWFKYSLDDTRIKLGSTCVKDMRPL